MKTKLTIFTILLFLFIGFVSFRFFIIDQKNAVGELKVASTPAASIFIDNVAVGKTPFHDKYKVGEFIIKIIPEGIATEAASWQGKVKIYKNSLTYINRELGSSDIASAGEIFTTTKMEKSPSNANFGEVYVETEPQGAIVYLDNDEKGVASMILSDILRGEHELSIFMPGFFRRTKKINIDPGYRVNAYIKLAIDQSQPMKSNETKSASNSGQLKKTYIIIKDTPTGWLRVREEASVNASESARVNPGEKFELIEEQTDWYKIKYDTNKEGWVSSVYSEKQAE